MSTEKKKMVQVTSVSALMADGTTLTWQGFRPADAQPGTPPTQYVITLPSNDAAPPQSVYNLQTIGAQCATHPIEVTVRDEPSATFTIPGQPPIKPGLNTPITLPVVGSAGPATLTFEGNDCTLLAKPLPPTGGSTAGAALRAGEGDAVTLGDDSGNQPPPPYPGSGR